MMVKRKGKRELEEGEGSAAAGPSTSKSLKLAATVDPNDANGGARAISSNELHPLLNPVVLSNLFKILPTQLFPNCRLVCRTWRDFLLSTSSTSPSLQLLYHSRNRNIFLGSHSLTAPLDRTPLAQFLDCWEQFPTPPPYQKFRLVRWDLSKKDSGLQSPTLQVSLRFFGLVGPSITALELITPTFKDLAQFQKLILGGCPNLRTLVVDGPHFNRIQPKKYDKGTDLNLEPHLHLQTLTLSNCPPNCPFWLVLLHNCPGLTAIKIDKYDPPSPPVLALEVLSSVKTIREEEGEGDAKNKRLRLKHFQIQPCWKLSQNNDLPENVMELMVFIRELKLPPQQSIAIDLNGCELERIEHVIKLHGDQLRKITAVKEDFSHNLDPFTFPCGFPFGVQLNNLEELTLSDGFCPSLEFLRFTPNLKSLHILDNDNWGGWKPFGSDYGWPPVGTKMIAKSPKTRMADVKLGKLEALYLGYVVSLDDLHSLISWLPNVKKLAMFLNNEQFAIVCDKWRKLEDLLVFGEELTEEGTTSGVKLDGGGGEGTRRPNITYLERLRTFRLLRMGA